MRCITRRFQNTYLVGFDDGLMKMRKMMFTKYAVYLNMGTF